MSKTKQRSTTKTVAGKQASSKQENRPSLLKEKTTESLPENNMLAGVMSSMRASGLDMDSQAVQDQLQGFLAGMVIQQAQAKLAQSNVEAVEKTKQMINIIDQKAELLPGVPNFKDKKEKAQKKPDKTEKLTREAKNLKYQYLVQEKIDWDSIERRPQRSARTPSKYNDMVTPTKVLAVKGTEKKNLQASGSTVEATPTPKKNQDDKTKSAAVFEPRGTRSSAPAPVEAPKSKKIAPITVKKSQLVEPTKKAKESGKSSKIASSISPRKGCQNELRRLLENNLSADSLKERRGGLRDEFDPKNRRINAKVSQMQKRNVRGAPIVKKNQKPSPSPNTKMTSPLKLSVKKVEKSTPRQSPSPRKQETKKEDRKPVKKIIEKEKKKQLVGIKRPHRDLTPEKRAKAHLLPPVVPMSAREKRASKERSPSSERGRPSKATKKQAEKMKHRLVDAHIERQEKICDSVSTERIKEQIELLKAQLAQTNTPVKEYKPARSSRRGEPATEKLNKKEIKVASPRKPRHSPKVTKATPKKNSAQKSPLKQSPEKQQKSPRKAITPQKQSSVKQASASKYADFLDLPEDDELSQTVQPVFSQRRLGADISSSNISELEQDQVDVPMTESEKEESEPQASESEELDKDSDSDFDMKNGTTVVKNGRMNWKSPERDQSPLKEIQPQLPQESPERKKRGRPFKQVVLDSVSHTESEVEDSPQVEAQQVQEDQSDDEEACYKPGQATDFHIQPRVPEQDVESSDELIQSEQESEAKAEDSLLQLPANQAFSPKEQSENEELESSSVDDIMREIERVKASLQKCSQEPIVQKVELESEIDRTESEQIESELESEVEKESIEQTPSVEDDVEMKQQSQAELPEDLHDLGLDDILEQKQMSEPSGQSSHQSNQEMLQDDLDVPEEVKVLPLPVKEMEFQEESVYEAVSDSESDHSQSSSDKASILQEQEKSEDDNCEVQSQYVFEHDFAKIEIDREFIAETFGKNRNGGRVTPRNLYCSDLILQEEASGNDESVYTSRRSFDHTNREYSVHHPKNPKKIKCKKRLVKQYWESILTELKPHGLNNRLPLPESWKDLYNMFVNLDGHLNMAKSRKSGVQFSVTLPMISSMFAQAEHRRFSQKHLARILAIVPKDFFIYKWVFKKDKFELCLDYPQEETTQGSTQQPFNSGVISQSRLQWRKNKFLTEMQKLAYKVWYEQRHPADINKKGKLEQLVNDSVESSELLNGWPEDFQMTIVKPVQHYLAHRIQKAITQQPETLKKESVSQFFGKFDCRQKVLDMQNQQMENGFEINEDELDLESQQSRVELSQSGLSEDTINKVTMKYKLQDAARAENKVNLGRQEYLQTIQLYQRIADQTRALFINKNKGTLDFNEVIDDLRKNSTYQGMFHGRDEFKQALLMLIKILPEWLSPCYLPKRVLLKFHKQALTLFDVNARIKEHFEKTQMIVD